MQVGQTLFEVVSKLPEVTLKAHDQINFFTMEILYLELAVNFSNTPSISRTMFKF